MIPPFPIEGGLPLAASRAVSVAGLMAAFGGLLTTAWLRPAGLQAPTLRRLDGAAWIGLAAAFGGALLWLAMQTLDLAGGLGVGDLRAVLADTQFGQLLACRLVLLLGAAGALAARRRRWAAGLAGLALIAQAGHSHAEAMYGPGWLLLSSGLHLLAAGAWLGGLIPLALVCLSEPVATARLAARRFSPLGMACVATLAVTATVQSLAWIGDLPRLLGTAYGWIACLKLGLFAALVALAAINWRQHARAPQHFTAASRRALVRRIAGETGLGLAVVFAAGVMTELPPSMHVQPIWPFPWVPSLATLQEDPDYRREALLAAGALLLAALLLVGSVIAVRKPGRRRAWGGLAAGAGLLTAMLAVPHFAPLLVPAVPTAFIRSPTGYGAISIADGEPIYRARCAACHGPDGRGDGPAARALAIPPADLTAAHLFMHADGQLYWWIAHGIEAPSGGLAMPASPDLSDAELWALIDFLHARNTGLAVHGDGRTVAIAAPDAPLACGSGPSSLSALHGRAVLLVFGTAPAPRPTAALLVGEGEAPPPGACILDPADIARIARAYAIATGRAGIAGGAALIDAQGWLRQTWDHAGDPALARSLAEAVQSAAAHPLAPATGETSHDMAGMKMVGMPMTR